MRGYGKREGKDPTGNGGVPFACGVGVSHRNGGKRHPYTHQESTRWVPRRGRCGTVGQPQRKMVNIDVMETSGVDHPAHLHEGWIVCKSADEKQAEALLGGNLNTTKGTTVAEKDGTVSAEELAKAVAEVEALKLEKAALETERDEAVAKAAAAEPAPVVKSAEQEKEDMLKSVPPAVREMLEKQAAETESLRKSAAEDRANFEKERDARLDQAAVTDFRTMFKSVALDAEKVAPALRQVGLISPDLAKAVTEALKAADGQVESANLFKELGSTADPMNAGEGTAYAKIVAAGEELRKSEAGKDLTAEQAFSKALRLNPDLYNAYEAEKAGK